MNQDMITIQQYSLMMITKAVKPPTKGLLTSGDIISEDLTICIYGTLIPCLCTLLAAYRYVHLSLDHFARNCNNVSS